MARFVYAVPFALTFALTACGSKSSSDTPDAPVIMTTDAPPPDAAPPDAFACAAPLKECTAMACADTTNDEANCSQCGMACKGGEVCTTSACACPSPQNFLGTAIAANPTDQFIDQSVFLVGIAPVVSGTALNGLVVGVQSGNGGTAVDTDYTLTAPSGGGLPSFPLVAALYGFSGQATDANYVATAGKLRFSAITHVKMDPPNDDKNCNELTGTMTDVTFQGATGSIQSGGMVDPNGCSFTIPKLTFDIKVGAGCPK